MSQVNAPPRMAHPSQGCRINAMLPSINYPIFKFNTPHIPSILNGKSECKPYILSHARPIKTAGHKLFKGELLAVTSAPCLQEPKFA